MKKTEFAKMVGIGQNTLAKLSKNEFVSMEVLVKICRGLDCTPIEKSIAWKSIWNILYLKLFKNILIKAV